jgi:pimeloyl-ACP methyl ester carboxylesterase
MNKMPENVLLSRKDADKYLREHILDKTTRQFILQNLIFVDGRLKWRLNIPCLIREMDKIVTWPSTKRSSCLKPTFFICGEHSDRVSEKNNRAIAAYFPNNTKHIVSGGSHWPQVEAPKEFLKILKNLLSPIDSKC